MTDKQKQEDEFHDPVYEKSNSNREKIIEANKEKLTEFSKLMEGGRKATPEQRRDRIRKMTWVKRISKWAILGGMGAMVLSAYSVGQVLVIVGIAGTAVSNMGIKMNTTAQMVEENEINEMNKERMSYGLPVQPVLNSAKSENENPPVSSATDKKHKKKKDKEPEKEKDPESNDLAEESKNIANDLLNVSVNLKK